MTDETVLADSEELELMDTDDLVSRLVDLDKRKRALMSELEEVQEERTAVQNMILERWDRTEKTRATIRGVTVYRAHQTWARPKNGDYERACAALQKIGLGDLVQTRFNTNTLSAWVREQEDTDTPLPEELRDVIEVDTVWSIRTRKA
jgi:hypothetical protein